MYNTLHLSMAFVGIWYASWCYSNKAIDDNFSVRRLRQCSSSDLLSARIFVQLEITPASVSNMPALMPRIPTVQFCMAPR
jgi:hypothetical protein